MSDEKPKQDAETFLHENMRSRRSRVVESAWRKPEPDAPLPHVVGRTLSA